MVKIQEYKENYKALFIGDNEEYLKFFNVITSNNEAYKLKGEKGWSIPKNFLIELEKHFKIENVNSKLANIGQGLKLEPYLYQKEAIYYSRINSKALLILPCGAGKL